MNTDAFLLTIMAILILFLLVARWLAKRSLPGIGDDPEDCLKGDEVFLDIIQECDTINLDVLHPGQPIQAISPNDLATLGAWFAAPCTTYWVDHDRGTASLKQAWPTAYGRELDDKNELDRRQQLLAACAYIVAAIRVIDHDPRFTISPKIE